MATRTIYHLLPHAQGWQIKQRGGSRAVSLHTTKSAATAAGKKLCLNKAPSQLVVHKADGTIASEQLFEAKELSAKRSRQSSAKKAAATRKRNAAKKAVSRSRSAKKAANSRRK